MFINKPEIIEKYILGKLTGAELIQFESELVKDKLLQSEVGIQKEVITSIQQYRKLQLKQRMDNITVSAGNSYNGLKVAASILLAGLVTYGVFNYNEVKNSKEITKSVSPINQNKNEQSNNLISKKIETEVENTTTNPIIKNNSAKPVANVIKPTELSIESNAKDVVVEAPNADNFAHSGQITKEANVVLPKGELAQGNGDHTFKAEVIVDGVDKSRFHYKYYSGKLFLYGEFENPYELLEWNSADGKKLYLKYDGAYYKIQNNQTEAVKLEKIIDNSLLNELRQITK